MPRGAKPGERRGGRYKGIPNKATTERALQAERDIARAKGENRRLGKEILDDFANLFWQLAVRAQPLPENQPILPGRKPNEVEFEKWSRLACETAAKLAPYQSPTFRAFQVIAGPTDPAAGAKVIDNDNVVPLNDPNGAMRVYLRTMKAGGGR